MSRFSSFNVDIKYDAAEKYNIDQSEILSKTAYLTVKRISDFIFALTALIVLCIPMLIIAVVISLDSSGSPIFAQERLGKNAKPFVMYKFRSMYTDAEALGPQWAAVNDSRCTRVGRFLRKSRLDELPQLFNILKGGISMTSTTNPDFSEHLNNFYNNNPFVQLLGIQLEKIQFGQVTLSMKAQNQLSNFYHITHGGALASLADTTMGATCLSVNKKVVTQSMNMYFVKAVPEGSTIQATGKIIHNGRKTLVCETEIVDDQGQVCCKATANFFVIGPYTA